MFIMELHDCCMTGKPFFFAGQPSSYCNLGRQNIIRRFLIKYKLKLHYACCTRSEKTNLVILYCRYSGTLFTSTDW